MISPAWRAEGIRNVPLLPNYRLQQCYEATPELHAVKPLTLRKSLGSLRLNLYDEHQRRLVSFRSLKERNRQA